MGGGPRDLDGWDFQGLKVVMWFVAAIQGGICLGHGEEVRKRYGFLGERKNLEEKVSLKKGDQRARRGLNQNEILMRRKRRSYTKGGGTSVHILICMETQVP